MAYKFKVTVKNSLLSQVSDTPSLLPYQSLLAGNISNTDTSTLTVVPDNYIPKKNEILYITDAAYVNAQINSYGWKREVEGYFSMAAEAMAITFLFLKWADYSPYAFIATPFLIHSMAQVERHWMAAVEDGHQPTKTLADTEYIDCGHKFLGAPNVAYQYVTHFITPFLYALSVAFSLTVVGKGVSDMSFWGGRVSAICPTS